MRFVFLIFNSFFLDSSLISCLLLVILIIHTSISVMSSFLFHWFLESLASVHNNLLNWTDYIYTHYTYKWFGVDHPWYKMFSKLYWKLGSYIILRLFLRVYLLCLVVFWGVDEVRKFARFFHKIKKKKEKVNKIKKKERKSLSDSSNVCMI